MSERRNLCSWVHGRTDKLTVLRSGYKKSWVNWFSAFCFHVASWTRIFHRGRNYCHLYVLRHKAAHVYSHQKMTLGFSLSFKGGRFLHILACSGLVASHPKVPFFKLEQGQTWQPVYIDNAWPFPHCVHVRCSASCPLYLSVGNYYRI